MEQMKLTEEDQARLNELVSEVGLMESELAKLAKQADAVHNSIADAHRERAKILYGMEPGVIVKNILGSEFVIVEARCKYAASVELWGKMKTLEGKDAAQPIWSRPLKIVGRMTDDEYKRLVGEQN